MVSSQILPSVKYYIHKPIQHQILLPVSPPDVIPSEQFEFDFSDVFGSPPIHASNEVSNGNNGEINEIGYDDHVVIYNRSHSLVGLSAGVSQSLKLSGLTIHETEEKIEFVDSVIDVTSKNCLETSMEDCGNMMNTETVDLEDFDVLKGIGRGAFANVYQARKRGTSDIYAMKIMRKDKIMGKNHAEYMKAERDILSKIDHPFIVQLRYSFQTKYRLYLVLDFINGGNLFFQLNHQGLFREEQARIYTAEIVSAVQMELCTEISNLRISFWMQMDMSYLLTLD